MTDITMPDFKQWAKNLIAFTKMTPDAADRVIEENIKDIWNKARAYERNKMLDKIDAWDDNINVI